VEAARFRQVLGHFCTGVTVITGAENGRPAGFACQAFAALSLDPPLVLFCPSRSSATWPAIARAGHFCVNVLAAGQQDIARRFGTSGADKFAQLAYSLSPSGAPILAGALTWAECAVTAVHEAGDHYVVVGSVTELGPLAPDLPLLFYRGRYAAIDQGSANGPPEVVDTLLAWPRHADWMLPFRAQRPVLPIMRLRYSGPPGSLIGLCRGNGARYGGGGP
jgi:3-hydroxy-9,10-secoandrosta-1,3,5(10)-triene-9,17-dione monooxygenase reductase component